MSFSLKTFLSDSLLVTDDDKIYVKTKQGSALTILQDLIGPYTAKGGLFIQDTAPLYKNQLSIEKNPQTSEVFWYVTVKAVDDKPRPVIPIIKSKYYFKDPNSPLLRWEAFYETGTVSMNERIEVTPYKGKLCF